MRFYLPPFTIPATARYPDGTGAGGIALPPFTWYRIHHRTKTATGDLYVSLDGPAVGRADSDFDIISPGERRVRNVAGMDEADPYAKELNLYNSDAASVVVQVEVSDTPIVDIRSETTGAGTRETFGADGLPATDFGPAEQARGYAFNGTTWDRLRTAAGAVAGGPLAVALQDGTAASLSTVATPTTDAASSFPSLYVRAVLTRYNGLLWDRWRTPNVFKKIQAVAITAATPVSVWTPAAGKKFRLIAYFLSLSVAGKILFEDATGGANEFMRTGAMAAGVGVASPDIGNGFLSAVANNGLFLDVSASGTVDGFVCGTEE